MKLLGQIALDAASTDETTATIDMRQLGALQTTHYIKWGTGVSAGVVEIETADASAYAGTWASVATVTFSGTAPRVDFVVVTGTYGAFRHRISTAIAGGTVTTKIEAAGA